MGKKNKQDGRISARDLPPLKAWAFPRVAGAHVVRSPFKEHQAAAAVSPSDELPVSQGPLTVGEIDKLRSDARQQGMAQGLAEGRKQGHQQGLEAGRAEGHQAAYQAAEAEINDLKARLRSMQQVLEKPLAAQLDGLEQALLRMVIDTAEVVVKQELATRPELLRQAVRESLDALPQHAQQLCFFVHPDDELLLQQLRDQERAAWEVVADPALGRGGLRVRGECSFLDYAVEKRFSQVAAQVIAADEPAADEGGTDG